MGVERTCLIKEELKTAKDLANGEERCPLEYGFDIFCGKWKPRILCLLGASGILRYSELRREMSNVSDAVLAQALKSLVDEGIIERRQFPEIPPRVEYALTEKGQSVIPILKSICRWSRTYEVETNLRAPKNCRGCMQRGADGEASEQF